MEFEQNKPVTAQDLALADTPKVTLQPTREVDFQPVIKDRSHRDEGSFEFESESTGAAALASSNANQRSHHRMALIISAAIALSFIALLVIVNLFR